MNWLPWRCWQKKILLRSKIFGHDFEIESWRRNEIFQVSRYHTHIYSEWIKGFRAHGQFWIRCFSDGTIQIFKSFILVELSKLFLIKKETIISHHFSTHFVHLCYIAFARDVKLDLFKKYILVRRKFPAFSFNSASWKCRWEFFFSLSINKTIFVM